jgi:hypothetical protein
VTENRNYTLLGFDDNKKLKAFQIVVPKKDDVEHYLSEKGKELELKSVMWRKTPGSDARLWEPFLAVWNYPDYLDEEPEACNFSSFEEAYNLLTSECGKDGWYGIYNLKTEKMVNVKIYDWSDRDNAKNAKEAMEYISHYLADNWSGMGKRQANQVAKYAEGHNIPFSADLAVTFRKAFQLHQPQWNSSSAYC